ncbi:MAG: hypothetical protein AB7N80_08070 [Bdellovibrionales bacterium]
MSEENKPQQPVVTEATAQTDQVVDIDQLEVEVLIICKNPAGFQQCASFLSRRGWPTTVMGNLSKAIDYIVKNSPDFVMLSCNHPNPGTQRLPNLLAQMKTTCIGFSETGDASSNAKLAGLALKHKLQGLPSGPNVQRMIRKILMEIYNPHAAAKESEGQESNDGKDRTVVTGSNAKGKDGNSISIKGSEQGSTGPLSQGKDDDESLDVGNYRMGRKKERKRLKDLNSGDGGQKEAGGEAAQIDKKALLELAAQSDEKARGESGMMFMPNKGEDIQNHEQEKARSVDRNREAQTEPHLAKDGFSAIQKGGSSNAHNATQEGGDSLKHNVTEQGPDSLKHSEHQQAQAGKSLSSQQKAGPAANGFSAAQAGSSGDKANAATQTATDQSPELSSTEAGRSPNTNGKNGAQSNAGDVANGSPASQGQNRKEQRNGPVVPIKPLKTFVDSDGQALKAGSFQSLFEKSIQIALERTCKVGMPGKSNEYVDTVATLPIDSPELYGYLVVNIAGLRPEVLMQFITEFRYELCKVMEELNVQASIEDGFVLVQQQFHFMDWSMQEASLCLTTEHDGYVVGVSFLPTAERLKDPRESEKPDMALISLDHIDTEKPVPFKAYLHFKRSDRFYLYIRNGRRLFAEQKQRLLKRKISDFYIKSVDINNFRTYSAANFISKSLRKIKTSKAG